MLTKHYNPIIWQKEYGFYKLNVDDFNFEKDGHYYSDPDEEKYIFTMYGEKYDESVEMERPLIYKFEVYVEKTDEGYRLIDSGNIYINWSESDDEYTDNEERSWEQEGGLDLDTDEIYQDVYEISDKVYEKALQHLEWDKSKWETRQNNLVKKNYSKSNEKVFYDVVKTFHKSLSKNPVSTLEQGIYRDFYGVEDFQRLSKLLEKRLYIIFEWDQFNTNYDEVRVGYSQYTDLEDWNNSKVEWLITLRFNEYKFEKTKPISKWEYLCNLFWDLMNRWESKLAFELEKNRQKLW